jgi:hypothetical protein
MALLFPIYSWVYYGLYYMNDYMQLPEAKNYKKNYRCFVKNGCFQVHL